MDNNVLEYFTYQVFLYIAIYTFFIITKLINKFLVHLHKLH